MYALLLSSPYRSIHRHHRKSQKPHMNNSCVNIQWSKISQHLEKYKVQSRASYTVTDSSCLDPCIQLGKNFSSPVHFVWTEMLQAFHFTKCIHSQSRLTSVLQPLIPSHQSTVSLMRKGSRMEPIPLFKTCMSIVGQSNFPQLN